MRNSPRLTHDRDAAPKCLVERQSRSRPFTHECDNTRAATCSCLVREIFERKKKQIHRVYNNFEFNEPRTLEWDLTPRSTRTIYEFPSKSLESPRFTRRPRKILGAAIVKCIFSRDNSPREPGGKTPLESSVEVSLIESSTGVSIHFSTEKSDCAAVCLYLSFYFFFCCRKRNRRVVGCGSDLTHGTLRISPGYSKVGPLFRLIGKNTGDITLRG